MTQSMHRIFVKTLFQNDVTRLCIGMFRYRGTLNKNMSDLGKAQPQLSDWSYLAMLNKFNRNWDKDFYHLLKWTPTCQKYTYHIKVFSIFTMFHRSG